jgi:hypothetical protein
MHVNDSFSADSDYAEALGAALDFSYDDLQDNRAGLLSVRQRQRLQKAFKRDMLLICGGLLLIILISSRRAGWNFAGGSWDDRALVSGVLMFIVLVVVVVATVFAVRRYRRDTQSGRVAQASGSIRLRTEMRSSTRSNTVYTAYLVDVADLTFELPFQAHALLQDGATYTVYYTPHIKKIVSIM